MRNPSALVAGRCHELLVGSGGYFAKLPWCRAGGVLREVCEVGWGGKQARRGIRQRPAGWVPCVLLLRIDRWWPQQLQPTPQHLVRAIRSHCYSPHPAEERSAADTVSPASRLFRRGGRGRARGSSEATHRRFVGPAEEREAPGRAAAACITQAGVLDAGRPARALHSRPRLVRPLRGSWPRLGGCGLPLAVPAAS